MFEKLLILHAYRKTVIEHVLKIINKKDKNKFF
jgi:hypothetical protein